MHNSDTHDEMRRQARTHTHTHTHKSYTPTVIIHGSEGEDDDEVTDRGAGFSLHEYETDGWIQRQAAVFTSSSRDRDEDDR